MIHNSSFGSIDLEIGTKAQITDCYIDSELKERPTLIRANNSDVLIQKCHFGNFVNENNSTNRSHVKIDNSNIIQHNISKGILFLEQNCSLSINNSLISQNVALTHGYSAITLPDRIHVVIPNSVFENNSALVGRAINAEDQIHLELTNCTFSRNKVKGWRGGGGAIFVEQQTELFFYQVMFFTIILLIILEVL